MFAAAPLRICLDSLMLYNVVARGIKPEMTFNNAEMTFVP